MGPIIGLGGDRRSVPEAIQPVHGRRQGGGENRATILETLGPRRLKSQGEGWILLHQPNGLGPALFLMRLGLVQNQAWGGEIMPIDRPLLLKGEAVRDPLQNALPARGPRAGIDFIEVKALGFPVLVEGKVHHTAGTSTRPPPHQGANFLGLKSKEIPVQIDAVGIFPDSSPEAAGIQNRSDHPVIMLRQSGNRFQKIEKG